MANDRERITFEEAKALYPDEWVVFRAPNTREEDTSFVNGIVYFHSRDQEAVFEKAGEVAGAVAILYTGERKYRDVTFKLLDAVHKPAA